MNEKELLELIDKMNRIIHKDAREFKGGLLTGDEVEIYNQARKITQKYIDNNRICGICDSVVKDYENTKEGDRYRCPHCCTLVQKYYSIELNENSI